MPRYSLFEAFNNIRIKTESHDFLENSRTKQTAFTRLRKLSFCDMIYFMLSIKRRCVQHELDNFANQKGLKNVSRQAFSKQREFIKPEAIRDINDGLVADFENIDGYIKTLHNHRVFAVDGSVIDLPESTDLRQHFGFSSGTADTTHAKARAMVVYDLLNGICPYGELISFFTSETTYMHTISDSFSGFEKYKQCIFVMDRGYPSFNLFKRIGLNNQYYLARVTSSFYKDIVNAKDDDQIVTIKKKKENLDLRVLKTKLPSGNTEILVTNLPEIFTYTELINLYRQRWGIETNYHYLKNVELLECFTGESIRAVLQDFYTCIVTLNLATIAYREQEDKLIKNKKEKKHNYKPNKKQIICDIKTDFIKLLMSKSKFSKVYKQLFLLHRIKKYAYADIPDRSRPRKDPKRHSTLKAHPKSPL